MNKVIKTGLVFIVLLIYNFLIVDKVSFYFNLSGGMKSISSISPISALSALVFAPIIEESLFRGALLKGNMFKYFIYIIISICVLFFVDVYSGGVLFCFFCGMLCVVLKKKVEEEFVFRVFIVIGALAFSFIHIPVINAPTLAINIFIAVMAFFPVGLFFSFVRGEYGLRYSIIIHGCYNLIVLGINEIVY